MWLKIVGCALFLCLWGCGDAPSDLGFTAKDAEKFLHDLNREVKAGNTAGVAALCRAPLQLRTRTWRTTEDIAKNLPSEFAEWKTEFDLATEMEVFTYADLMGGRWPRGRTVPEDSREREALKLGVLPGHFLVRTAAAAKAGVLWVLAPEGVTRLLLVAVH